MPVFFSCRPRFFLPSALLFCLLLCGLWACPKASAAEEAFDLSTPFGAVEAVQYAIDTKDYSLFSSLVNVDSFVQKAVSDGLNAVSKKLADANKEAGDLTVDMLLSLVGDGVKEGDFVTSMVSGECKAFLQAAVKGGYLAGKPDPSRAGSGGMFASGLKNLGKSRKEIIPTRELSRQDGEATVEATWLDPQAGVFPLRLRLAEMQGAWQVQYVDNIREIVEMSTFHVP